MRSKLGFVVLLLVSGLCVNISNTQVQVDPAPKTHFYVQEGGVWTLCLSTLFAHGCLLWWCFMQPHFGSGRGSGLDQVWLYEHPKKSCKAGSGRFPRIHFRSGPKCWTFEDLKLRWWHAALIWGCLHLYQVNSVGTVTLLYIVTQGLCNSYLFWRIFCLESGLLKNIILFEEYVWTPSNTEI